MGGEDVSDEVRGVTNGKVLAFGGVEIQLPISGPADGDDRLTHCTPPSTKAT